MSLTITIISIIIGLIFAEITFIFSIMLFKNKFGKDSVGILESSLFKTLCFLLMIPLFYSLFKWIEDMGFDNFWNQFGNIGLGISTAILVLAGIILLYWLNYKIAKSI